MRGGAFEPFQLNLFFFWAMQLGSREISPRRLGPQQVRFLPHAATKAQASPYNRQRRSSVLDIKFPKLASLAGCRHQLPSCTNRRLSQYPARCRAPSRSRGRPGLAPRHRRARRRAELLRTDVGKAGGCSWERLRNAPAPRKIAAAISSPQFAHHFPLPSKGRGQPEFVGSKEFAATNDRGLITPSLRGAKRRSNPGCASALDCFASLAMTMKLIDSTAATRGISTQ